MTIIKKTLCTTAFGPQQLFLSCGEEVTLNSQSIGYGFDNFFEIPSERTSSVSIVLPWENNMEEQLNEVQV